MSPSQASIFSSMRFLYFLGYVLSTPFLSALAQDPVQQAQEALRVVAANANKNFIQLAKVTHDNKLNWWKEHLAVTDWVGRNSHKSHYFSEIRDRKHVSTGAWNKYMISLHDARKELSTNRLISEVVKGTQLARELPVQPVPKQVPAMIAKTKALIQAANDARRREMQEVEHYKTEALIEQIRIYRQGKARREQERLERIGARLRPRPIGKTREQAQKKRTH